MDFSAQILAVKNMNTMIEFYCKNLNFEVLTIVPNEDTPQFTILQNGNVQVMLETVESLSKSNPSLENPLNQSQQYGIGVINYIKTDDVSDLYNKLVENSVPVVKELHETWYGTKEFAIEDPEGYVVMFSQ
jgi:uncharacterized glyoxalase superfamily protein PhnB